MRTQARETYKSSTLRYNQREVIYMRDKRLIKRRRMNNKIIDKLIMKDGRRKTEAEMGA
jgi:hypothetical protein